MTAVLRATQSDIPQIALLVKQYWEFENIAGFDLTRTERNLALLLSAPDRGACWIAESNGSIAGYLIAVYVFSLEYGGMIAEIDELFVSDEYRTAGTGRALLRKGEEEMRSLGVLHIQLQVGIENARAQSFYERFGYARRSGYALLEKSLTLE